MKAFYKVLSDIFNLKSFVPITTVVMDTRNVEKGSLFFAINGGNSHIDEALENGASLVIADKYFGNDERVIKVDNTVVAMQNLAEKYREKLNVKVIGITGSNGKTTTKDIMFSILSQKYKCHKTSGNFNNHIGLPFTILQLKDEDEVAILEMGMSGIGEIDKLCQIAKPDFAVITNIGESHLENLKSRENVFKAKSEIVKYVKKQNLFIYGEDQFLSKLSGIKIGINNNLCDYNIKNLEIGGVTSKFTVLNKGISSNYEINLQGKHNVVNATFGIAIAEKIGLSYSEIVKGLLDVKLSPMRFQKIIKGNTIYINDAYNASPLSMKCSVETFDALYNDSYKIVILADMLELGVDEIKYHRDIINFVQTIRCDEIYLFGERMKEGLKGIKLIKNTKWIETKDEIKEILKQSLNLPRVILLKGSRGMKLEEIIGD